MKFAVATAFLAQSVGVASMDVSAVSSSFDGNRKGGVKSPLIDKIKGRKLQEGKSRRRASLFSKSTVQEGLGASLTNGKPGNVFSSILHKLNTLHKIVDCVPYAGSESNSLKQRADADIGILSCGVGRHCEPSFDSSLGGICVDDRQVASNPETNNVRALQESSNSGGRDSTIIQDLQYACDYAYLIGYECSCDLDGDAYSGTATCTSPSSCNTRISACNTNVSYCSSETYSVDVVSPGLWETEFCIDFSTPYEQQTCYGTSVIDFGQDVRPDCVVKVNGETCDSCTAYPSFVQDANTNETYLSDTCYAFDCSNTEAGSNGNTCDFPVDTMELYLDTYGCPACNLCGMSGTMLSPDSSVFIMNNTYTCEYVEEVSAMGFFTEDTCAYFSSAVDGPCACDSGIEPTVTPIESNGTESPTQAPSAEVNGTSIAPSEGTGSVTSPPTIAETDIENPSVESCNPCQGGDLVSPNGILVLPGQTEQISCTELRAATINGSIPFELCPSVQNLAAVPCCGAVDEVDKEEDLFDGPCNPCGPDKEMTDFNGMVSVPSQGMFSCQQLSIMGRTAEEDEDWCVLIRPFVQTPCGCRSTVPTVAPTEAPISPDTPATSLQDSASAGTSILISAATSILLILSLTMK